MKKPVALFSGCKGPDIARSLKEIEHSFKKLLNNLESVQVLDTPMNTSSFIVFIHVASMCSTIQNYVQDSNKSTVLIHTNVVLSHIML